MNTAINSGDFAETTHFLKEKAPREKVSYFLAASKIIKLITNAASLPMTFLLLFPCSKCGRENIKLP
jgi:hypothetical protein